MTSHLFETSKAILIPSTATALTQQSPTISWRDKAKVVEFGGLSYGARHVINSRFGHTTPGRSITLDDIRDSMGEWTAVVHQAESDTDRYLVLADRYGYGSTFYSYLPGIGLIVADTFEGVSNALSTRKRTLDLDLANYVVTISSSARTFLNPMSSRTMIRQISLLEPDKAIEISEKQARIVPRSIVGGAQSIHDYKDAIEAGIDLSTRAIQQLSDLPDITKRLTLSGGVDSRLALALLHAAGVEKEFRVFSIDPRTWKNRKTKHVIQRDVEIANALREDAGMDWWNGAPQEFISIPFTDSLKLHQKFKSNYYYLYYPTQQFRYFTSPQLTVRGGGGEILRSTQGGASMLKRYERFIQDNPSEPSDLSSWIASIYISWGDIEPGFKDFATASLAEGIGETDADSFETHMNNYYFRTRNRAHFGHVRHDLQTGDVPVQILSNPYFLQAAQILSFEERSTGQLVKDVFKRTAPHLLNYAFEDEQWTGRLSEEPVDMLSDEGSKWKSSYDEQKITDALSATSGWEQSRITKLSAPEQAQFFTNFLKEGFTALEGHVGQDAVQHLERQHDRVITGVANGRFNVNNTTAKMLSALEAYLPREKDPHECVERRVSTPAADEDPASMIGRVELPHRSSSTPLTSFDQPFTLVPTIEYNDGVFTIDCQARGSNNYEMTYAVYLYRDDERIADSWYQRSPEHTLSGSFEPGTYTATAFARFADKGRPTFQGKTSSLEVQADQ